MSWEAWQDRLRRWDEMVAERERLYRRIRVCPLCGRRWITTLTDREFDRGMTRSYIHDACLHGCLPPLSPPDNPQSADPSIRRSVDPPTLNPPNHRPPIR